MRLQLGINTCFAVKRWPLAQEWAQVVRDELGLRIVQHTFDLVDLQAPPARLEEQAGALKRAVAQHGLALHSTFTGLAAYSANLLLSPEAAYRAAAETWFRTAISFSADSGACATGGHVGCFSVHDWHDARRRSHLWTGLQRSLAQLASDASAAGLDYLVVENLAVTREPSTMAAIRELLDDGQDGRVPVRLCLDLGHMCVPGTSAADRDPYAWLRELGRWAPMVQLQQSDAEGDHHWPFTERYNAIGRISADRVIEALGESGAEDAVLILEVIPPFEQEETSVLSDLAESVAYWREALDSHGLHAG
jgi:D-erythrulose 1-phosphate 3-epimerase